MRRVLRVLKKTFCTKRFLVFSLLGLVNSFNTGWISAVASYAIPNPNTAAVLGYFCSLSIAFVLDSKLVFNRRLTKKRYFKFLISYVPNFIIYFLVTFMTINTWHLPQFWATTLATVIGGPITFVIIQFYTFRPKR
ncbi:MAG: GtrA family protein [Ruminococcaceae bacterium]|nr:GtrA family protein [Oscillospiraceae bacterium]